VRDDRERLRDVLEAIERIERYASRGRSVFEEDELIQNWVLHHLQIIGEAMRAVSPELRELHPVVPWKQVIGMRNILVHHYFSTDLEIVWQAVEKDLPALKSSVRDILDPGSHSSDS
jgi:uncharacterized protein with HEPN domain